MQSRIFLGGSLAILMLLSEQSHAADGRWFFSAREIEIAYKYQEQFGERLREYWEPKDCFYGKNEFTATYLGSRFQASCTFVKEIKRQLKEILDAGAGKYVFALDVGHAHLAVPTQLWKNKYNSLKDEQLYSTVLGDPQLTAIYHTADHLELKNSATDSDVKAWLSRRNVHARFDGSPIKILSPAKTNVGVPIPNDHHAFATVTVSAHRLGEVSFVSRGRAVIFDLSLESVLSAPPALASPDLVQLPIKSERR